MLYKKKKVCVTSTQLVLCSLLLKIHKRLEFNNTADQLGVVSTWYMGTLDTEAGGLEIWRHFGLVRPSICLFLSLTVKKLIIKQLIVNHWILSQKTGYSSLSSVCETFCRIRPTLSHKKAFNPFKRTEITHSASDHNEMNGVLYSRRNQKHVEII